jgi:hypothetical protein
MSPLAQARRRSHTLYALLLAGYLIMFLLIGEQSRTIESQKNLIRTLFHDTSQLADLRVKEARVAQHPGKK